MAQQHVALITGGMGGLGETISQKMADAGYKVAVTYSPSNKTADEWLARMRGNGYKLQAFQADVADFESCHQCVERVALLRHCTSLAMRCILETVMGDRGALRAERAR